MSLDIVIFTTHIQRNSNKTEKLIKIAPFLPFLHKEVAKKILPVLHVRNSSQIKIFDSLARIEFRFKKVIIQFFFNLRNYFMFS